MGKLKNLLIDTAEDEEFNRIERESKQRKEAVLQALHDENARLGLYKDAYGEKSVAMPDYLHLMEELSVARMLIRELGDRLSRLEKPWVDLTKEECFELCVKHKDNSFSLLVAVQEKLMEKNT
jgi:hypothetical protein